MQETHIEGVNYLTNEPIKIIVQNGLIKDILPLPGKNQKSLFYLGPGLVDLQVNGFSGIDFNSSDFLTSEINTITNSLMEEGVTTYFPTLVTNSESEIESEIQNIIEAYQIYPGLSKCIGGIHLEGPFISKEVETRGAHNPDYIQAPSWELLSKWQEIADGHIKIITISPEWQGSEEFIEKCTENDILVSIGHTIATPDQIIAAINAGAKLSTHLGNGSQLNITREDNYFWQQLTQNDLWASIIADGFHLPETILKVIMKLKFGRLILISDSTKFSRYKAGTYKSIIGNKVVLDNEGRLYIARNPKLLAGSAQSILDGVNYLLKMQLAPLEQLWNMASVKPSELLNLDVKGGISKGSPADLVLFQLEDNKIVIKETFKEGLSLYSSN